MALNNNMMRSIVLSIIVLIVLLSFFSTFITTPMSAGDAFNDSTRCADTGGSWNTSRIDGAGNIAQNTNNCRNQTGNITFTVGVQQNTIPLGNLLSGSGFVFILVMTVLLIVIIRGFMTKKGK